MALGWATNAVGPVKTGVEPLRAVGGRGLIEHHPTEFVIEGFCILFGLEVVVLLPPSPPAPGEAMNHLPCRTFRTEFWSALFIKYWFALVVHLRHACLAEVLAHHNVGGELAPRPGDPSIFHLKDDGTVCIRNATVSAFPLDARKDICSGLRKSSCYFHLNSSGFHARLP